MIGSAPVAHPRAHVAQRDEEGACALEHLAVAHLGLYRGRRPVWLALQDGGDHPVDGPLRAHLEEVPHAVLVQGVDVPGEVHRRGQLAGEVLCQQSGRQPGAGIVPAVDRGEHGDARRAARQVLERLAEGLPCGLHVVGVECRGDRQEPGIRAGGLGHGLRRFERLPRPGQHGLLRGVDVGEDHPVTGEGEDHVPLLRVADQAHHPEVAEGARDVGGLDACGNRLVGRVQVPCAGESQSGELAEAVSDEDARLHAEGFHEPRDGQLHGEDRGLHAHERAELPGSSLLVIDPVERVHEIESESLPGERVDLVDGLAEDGVALVEAPAHRDVLRPLAREAEGEARRRVGVHVRRCGP